MDDLFREALVMGRLTEGEIRKLEGNRRSRVVVEVAIEVDPLRRHDIGVTTAEVLEFFGKCGSVETISVREEWE